MPAGTRSGLFLNIPEEIAIYREKVVAAGSKISESNFARLTNVYAALLPIIDKVEVLYISAANSVAGMNIPVINRVNGLDFTTSSNITRSVVNDNYVFSHTQTNVFLPHGLSAQTNKELFFAIANPEIGVINLFFGDLSGERYGMHALWSNTTHVDCPVTTRASVAITPALNRTLVLNSTTPINRLYVNSIERVTSSRTVISVGSQPYQFFGGSSAPLKITACAWGLPLTVPEVQILTDALNLW